MGVCTLIPDFDIMPRRWSLELGCSNIGTTDFGKVLGQKDVTTQDGFI